MTDLLTVALPATLVGGFHGLNPGMGWLFALFLALQRRSERVLLGALIPIGLGHLASVALIAAVLLVARSSLPIATVRLATAVLLLGFGAYKAATIARHSRWVGLNVGARDLAWWSFLVATAHGSGLMIAPLILGTAGPVETVGLLAIHTASMLVVMAAIALVVYRKLGVEVLRTAWINFDVFWVGGLILAGLVSIGGLLLAPAH